MVFLFATFLFISVPSFAEKVFVGDSDPQKANDSSFIKKAFLDGEDWIRMDVNAKWDFLKGFQEAVSTIRFEIMGILDVPPPVPLEKMKKKPDESSGEGPDEHFPPKHDLDITKQINYIDRFYSDDKHIKIPIGYAIRIIKDEMRGILKEDIENHKKALLRMINDFNKHNQR